MEVNLQQASTLANQASYGCAPPRSLFTLKSFSERHASFLTLASLTNQVFKSNPRQSSKGEIAGNGMLDHGVIVRVNGSVLIDEDRYFAWIDALQKAGR